MFYAAKPSGRRSSQNRFDSSNNHPRRGRCRPHTSGNHPNRASSRLDTADSEPNQAHSHPNSLGDRLARARMGLAAISERPPQSKVNGFPRSERAKTNPRNIDTFGGSFPAVLSLESCGFDAKKCRCFGGPKTLVHFTGNHSPSIRQHPLRCQRPTYQC